MGETFHGGLRDVTWAQRHYPFVDLQMMLAWKHQRQAQLEAEMKNTSGKGNGLDQIKRVRGGHSSGVRIDKAESMREFDDIAGFAGSLGF